MRSRFQITFYSNKLPGGAEPILEQLGIKDAEEDGDIFYVTLEDTDPRLPALHQILMQHKAYDGEFREDIYTEEELDGARLLWMLPGEHKMCEAMERMTYDVSDACPECGIGRRQTSALFVRGKGPAKLARYRAIATLHRQVLVDDGLAEDLVNAGMTGMVFHEVVGVISQKRQVKLPWNQLTAVRTLPRMSPRTTNLDRGPVFPYEKLCETCRRDGYNPYNDDNRDATPRIVYRASDLRDARDVNATWEHEGFTHLQHGFLPNPFMLVTPKVRRVFLARGVTYFNWLPIRVEETEGG